jgi:hypothetical protein
MAIVHYLAGLDIGRLPALTRFRYDDLQQKIRRNMYLELPQTDGSLALLSPTLSSVNNNFEERLVRLVSEQADILDYLKERLMRGLIVDTAIIEGSSYFFQQNNHLLLARLKYFKEVEKLLEVKLYTVTHKDLIQNYSDKIYIGRCFLNLEKKTLHYRGLNLYVLSLMDQYEILKGRKPLLNEPEKYERSYFQEIQELIQEVVAEVIRVLDTTPRRFSPARWDLEELIRVKACYRGIIHLLLELVEEVSEFESVLMFHKENRFARYATKYKRDLKNIILHLNFNILSELSRRIQHHR